MDRVEPDLARLGSGTSGSGSPLSAAAMPRTISTSPAAPASTTPASRSTGSISRVCATVASPAATMLARSASRSAASAIARIAVSIVPSTGFFTARYAASLAERNAFARSSVSASDSVAPRTICERITPELPRAPISAARETSLREPGAVVGPVAVERLGDRAHGQRQVGAGVAVGHRIDVEVVDPARGSPRSRRARRSTSSRTRALMRSACTRWMTTSTAATVEPGEPLDLVAHLRADGRRDLGEVQAVLDDDVQLDAQRLRVALDADALAAEDPLDARAGREADDAVAAERRLGDDLRRPRRARW